MNHEETVLLTRYVKALCPQQAIDAYTPDAWHEAIGHLELDECRAAVTAVARRKPFVAPSEIIKEIAETRSASEPHSQACRGSDHGDCRVSWCGCACHPASLRAVTPADQRVVKRGGEPRQIGSGDFPRSG